MSTGAALASSRARVFAAYRRMFRARKDLFQGDVQAMRESRVAIKAEFVKNRSAPTVGPHFEGLLHMVDEAVDMMTHGIVRGDLNAQTGNYEVKVKPQHTHGAEHAHVEPITPETVAKLEKPMVDSSSSCQSSPKPSS